MWISDAGRSKNCLHIHRPVFATFASVQTVLEGITVEQDCSNLDSLPNITFTFDAQDYVLTPADYVLKETIMSNTQCIMGIMGADLPDDFKYVIVGDVFMRPYPTKFNRDDNTVTFYKY